MIELPASGAMAARWEAPATRVWGEPALLLLCTIWVLRLVEPHLLLPGAGTIQRLVILLSLPLLLTALQYARSSDLYWPLLLFWALHLTALPISPNRGLVLVGFKEMARVSILFTATVALFKKPDQALWLVKLFLLSFVWYGVLGLVSGGKFGSVGWHPSLGNPDGFGGFMVMAIGVGVCTMTSSAPRWRYLGYACFGLGLLGVAASFARGAVIGAALVLVLLWLRSPRKLVTFAAGIAVLGLLIPAIEIIHPGGIFWEEMKTIFTEGTSSGTGHGRKTMWQVGFRVWKQRPVLGVGSSNAGVVGSRLFEAGELEGKYKQPGRLYSRGLHNTYIQLLAEQGLVGFGLWILMLVGFLMRLRRLRSPEVVAAWNEAVGGQFDLRRLTLGLELAMVGYLTPAFFYNQVYRHWFFTLVAIVFVLYRSASSAVVVASDRSSVIRTVEPGANPGRSRR